MNTKYLSNLPLTLESGQLFYLRDHGSGELAHSIGLSEGGEVPALVHHVSSVVLGGAEEEVIGVNAERGIASVKHPQAFSYGADVENPRSPVCSLQPSFFPAHPKLSIPLGLHGRPDPALSAHVHLLQEANKRVSSRRGHATQEYNN